LVDWSFEAEDRDLASRGKLSEHAARQLLDLLQQLRPDAAGRIDGEDGRSLGLLSLDGPAGQQYQTRRQQGQPRPAR
jgi:hypothetical protein